MKTVLSVIGLLLVSAAGLSAQPRAERRNMALEQLRAGVWTERGGFDSFEPASGAPAGPIAARAMGGGFRVVNAGWDLPQLQTPTLTPTLGGPIVHAPIPVEVAQAQVARPQVAQVAAARAMPAVLNNQLTPCDDLRNKARRLRTAASQCDTDVSNGAPYCRVQRQFESPGIPLNLSAQEARGYASRFETVANSGDQYACLHFGGIGRVPEPEPRPMLERLKDAMDSMANEQVKIALVEFAAGGLLSKILYGPEAPWTMALRNHSHLDRVRADIRDKYRYPSAIPVRDGRMPYTLNTLSIAENLRLFLRDLVAPLINANMAYSTGSMGFVWQQVGEVHEGRREVTVRITALDKLRAGSASRVPMTKLELLPDDPMGPAGPLHTVALEWTWTEVISY